MSEKGETRQGELTATRGTRDPFDVLRQMTADLDRMFDDWRTVRWPFGGHRVSAPADAWAPRIDVLERDNRLITRVDLPGMKKEDVTVHVTENRLELSGERTKEKEETANDFHRREREYGRFYRAVPLPQGVKLDDVKATFADGVLEVSIPLPAKPAATARKVEIDEPKAGGQSAE
jgi:HSP20 family protein